MPPDFAAYFSPDYATARARFRAAATAAGGALEAHPVGDELTVDVALFAGPGPTVVLTSGVHGVEGPFGSAVQLACLTEFTATPPARRVVLVHAVNPHGFAYGRRFDRDNVDPNRNFLLPGEAYTGSPPLYPAIDHLLNPACPPRRVDDFPLRAGLSMLLHGRRALKNAIAAGQCDFPRGLFFGGHTPTAGHRVLVHNWTRWAGDTHTLWHLDFHTGLGPWGTHKLLLDTDAVADRARGVFGPDAVEVGDTGPTAYPSRGGLNRWARAMLPGVEVVSLCAEFGTYPDFAMFTGLRTENQTHHHAAGTPADIAAKARLRELFVPADPGWRRRAVTDGVELVRRAMTAT